MDSSVWIAVFRRNRPLDLSAIVDFDEIVTCLPVIQEVLQGLRHEGAYRTARQAMDNLPIVDAPIEQAVFDAAIDLYRSAQRAGVTVRSSIDCLIATSATRHGLEVLHQDRDYAALARISALQQRAV